MAQDAVLAQPFDIVAEPPSWRSPTRARLVALLYLTKSEVAVSVAKRASIATVREEARRI